MGVIHRKIKLVGPKGALALNALMDTGASESFIRPEKAKRISPFTKLDKPFTVELGKGTVEIREVIHASIYLNGYRMHWSLNVFPSLTEEVILGADFFQRYKIKLDPESEKVIVDPKALKVKLG